MNIMIVLITHWENDTKIALNTYNARSETAQRNPTTVMHGVLLQNSA